MQPTPHEDANARHSPSQPATGMAHHRAYNTPGQDDQWAVLRHEIVSEEMTRGSGSRQAEWDMRNTEDDAQASHAPYEEYEQAPNPNQVDIVVAGIGGAGMNAVNRMIHTRVRGVRFVALNTDAQVLNVSQAPARICLGQRYTKGLGSGGNASVGARAASESAEEIEAALGHPDLVFIAAGMGGGTGTGGAPVIAALARKLGALTIGIVTLPFTFEGYRRKKVAEEGLAALSEIVDALITIPNDRLLAVTGKDRNLADAFKIADDVLRQGVQGIAEVINVPGLVNVDFADVRSVLSEAGTALMSIGQGQGRNRAQRAADEAIAGGFLNVAIRGAQRVLFNISGGEDLTLFEINEVAELIGNAIDASADITFGAVIDPTLDDVIRVTLIAAGMQELRTARIAAVQLEQPLPARAPAYPAYQGTIRADRPEVPTSPRVLPGSQLPPSPSTPSATSAGQSARAPSQSGPIGHPPALQSRPQRSLDDLRGLRSMGRRQEMRRGPQNTNDGEDGYGDEAIDVPPFMKKYQ